MTVTIITKNNDSAGVVPSAGQLVKGELAVNVTDKRLYTLDASNNVVLISSGSDYIVPVTIVVTDNANPAVTVTQSGNGGAAVFNNAGSGSAVRITNTGSGNSFVVEDSSNPDSTPFVIDVSGRIIEGYTTTTTVLDPGGVSRTPNVQIHGLNTSTAGQSINNWSTSGSSYPVVYLSKSKSGVVGTQGVVASGDTLGDIQFSGDDGTNFVPAARIFAAVDGTPGTNDMPGRLVFSTTADGAATPTERLRITSTGAWALAGASNYGSQGQLLTSNGNAAPTWDDQFLSISFVFNAGGSTLPTGIAGDLTIPFNCTITEWTMLADQSGSVVVDVWKDTYANYPPTVADTITGSAKPTISAATKGQSSTLTGWTTTISAGDTLRFNIDSVSLMTRLTLSLKVKRT